MNAVGRIAPASVRRVPVRRLPVPPTRDRARSGTAAASTGPGEIRAPDIAGLLPEPAVAALVDHAARIGASDLFFSFNENHVAVSVRHLGIVRLVTMLATEHGRRCTSYIKAMAGMDLAEQRRPLDGRWVREDDRLFGVDERDDDDDEDEDGPAARWHSREPRCRADRPARQHDPDPARRGHGDPAAGQHAASDGARPARDVAAGAQRADRDARYPRRADPGERADRLGQDDDALCVPAASEQRRAEDPHDRGPDRVRRARAAAVADQPEGRRRISPSCCGACSASRPT